MPNAFLPLAVLIVALLGLRPAAGATTSAELQGCVGCRGAGGSGSSSGGTCDGMVSVMVQVEDGHCRWYLGVEPGVIDCRQYQGCKPTVTRSWSSLDPGTGLDFCVVVGGTRLCLEPKPGSGDGSGSDTRDSATLPCNGDTRRFTVSAPDCGLEASAEASCSRCQAAF